MLPNNLRLVLASRSPRRADLLAAAGIPFEVRAEDVDETPRKGESARDYVIRLAREKAEAVTAAECETVLAADTTVVIDGIIFGKPQDQLDARSMLYALSGRRHEVLTGICLRRGSSVISDCESTGVWFANLTTEDIDSYIETGEPSDKAGAYALQGIASRFVERIDGSYSNVVGLPVAAVYRHLTALANADVRL